MSIRQDGDDNNQRKDSESFYPPVSTPAFVATRFCPACGASIVPQAVVCPRCGSAVSDPPKDKTIAVLLAVFLSFWTWLYTYDRDKKKFWVGFILSILGSVLVLVYIGIFLIFGVWIWAIIDAATKPRDWYRYFGLR